MSQKVKFKISDFELDQIKEVVNIGASYASTALNQLAKRKIFITVPEVKIIKIEKTVEYIGNSEKIATAVLLKILGDTTGIMFFLFPDDSGLRLARLITKSKETSSVLSDFDRSALKEVGNILSGAFLTVLSKFLGISMLYSVSEVATDTLGSIINSVMAEVGRASDVALIFKVKMSIENENIPTQLYFLADPQFTNQILTITKEKISK